MMPLPIDTSPDRPIMVSRRADAGISGRKQRTRGSRERAKRIRDSPQHKTARRRSRTSLRAVGLEDHKSSGNNHEESGSGAGNDQCKHRQCQAECCPFERLWQTMIEAPIVSVVARPRMSASFWARRLTRSSMLTAAVCLKLTQG